MKLCNKNLHPMDDDNIGVRGRCMECDRAYQDQYRVTFPELVKKQHFAQCRTLKGRYRQVKFQAKKHRRPCILTLEEYAAVIRNPCFYCGGKLPPAGTGIDRINSKKGYTFTNVRPCCKRCNVAKNDMTEGEFATLIIAWYPWAKSYRRK
jgi:5-methylcytosine-specific restriction endonuclease McrA